VLVCEVFVSRSVYLQNPEPFKALLKKLVEHYGTVVSAQRAVGIGAETYYRIFREGKVSNVVGQKILNAHRLIAKYNKGVAA
jgi:hypothetical protein